MGFVLSLTKLLMLVMLRNKMCQMRYLKQNSVDLIKDISNQTVENTKFLRENNGYNQNFK